MEAGNKNSPSLGSDGSQSSWDPSEDDEEFDPSDDEELSTNKIRQDLVHEHDPVRMQEFKSREIQDEGEDFTPNRRTRMMILTPSRHNHKQNLETTMVYLSKTEQSVKLNEIR